MRPLHNLRRKALVESYRKKWYNIGLILYWSNVLVLPVCLVGILFDADNAKAFAEVFVLFAIGATVGMSLINNYRK